MRSITISISKDFWMTTAAETFSFQMHHTPILNSASVVWFFFPNQRLRKAEENYFDNFSMHFITIAICAKHH